MIQSWQATCPTKVTPAGGMSQKENLITCNRRTNRNSFAAPRESIRPPMRAGLASLYYIHTHIITLSLSHTHHALARAYEGHPPAKVGVATAVEDEQQKVKEECRELQRALSTKGV